MYGYFLEQHHVVYQPPRKMLLEIFPPSQMEEKKKGKEHLHGRFSSLSIRRVRKHDTQARGFFN